MSEIRDKVVVIPTIDSPTTICNFCQQTASLLANKNIVIICFLQGKSVKDIISKNIYPEQNFKLIYKKKDIYRFNVIDIIPFKRLKIIKKINFFISLTALKIFINIRWAKKEKIIWLFSPQYSSFLSIFKNYFSLYDAIDYHSTFANSKNKFYAQKDLESINIVLKNADIVTTTSKSLYRLYQKIRKNITIVPLGFDYPTFKKYSSYKTNVTLPKKHPIVGFIGGINYRLDFDLIISLVKKNLNWNFVFVGPLQKYDEDKFTKTANNFKKLISFNNVFHFKKQPKKNIPSIIKQFDICIIPYNIKNLFNLYCYPMKLYEYFYIGKPIVATPIKELKKYPQFIKVGNTAKEWEKHIKTLLFHSWPEKYKKEQKKLAFLNSWENKIDTISSILEKQSSENF